MQFNKPINLNGAELLIELQNGGVSITEIPFVDGNGNLHLNIDAKHKDIALQIVANHNGTIVSPEPTINDKLAIVGLNLNDLKEALGLA